MAVFTPTCIQALRFKTRFSGDRISRSVFAVFHIFLIKISESQLPGERGGGPSCLSTPYLRSAAPSSGRRDSQKYCFSYFFKSKFQKTGGGGPPCLSAPYLRSAGPSPGRRDSQKFFILFGIKISEDGGRRSTLLKCAVLKERGPLPRST